jgi:hypothetical protein
MTVRGATHCCTLHKSWQCVVQHIAAHCTSYDSACCISVWCNMSLHTAQVITACCTGYDSVWCNVSLHTTQVITACGAICHCTLHKLSLHVVQCVTAQCTSYCCMWCNVPLHTAQVITVHVSIHHCSAWCTAYHWKCCSNVSAQVISASVAHWSWSWVTCCWCHSSNWLKVNTAVALWIMFVKFWKYLWTWNRCKAKRHSARPKA